jgi:hypothetical protein
MGRAGDGLDHLLHLLVVDHRLDLNFNGEVSRSPPARFREAARSASVRNRGLHRPSSRESAGVPITTVSIEVVDPRLAKAAASNLRLLPPGEHGGVLAQGEPLRFRECCKESRLPDTRHPRGVLLFFVIQFNRGHALMRARPREGYALGVRKNRRGPDRPDGNQASGLTVLRSSR